MLTAGAEAALRARWSWRRGRSVPRTDAVLKGVDQRNVQRVEIERVRRRGRGRVWRSVKHVPGFPDLGDGRVCRGLVVSVVVVIVLDVTGR